MFTKYVLPLLALLGVGFAVKTVVEARQVPPASQPLRQPPSRPKVKIALTGTGLIEAKRENIPIGVNVPGVVTEVFVKIGDPVKKGAPLFRVDDRELRAELKVRESALLAAKAQLHKLEFAPRKEDLPPLAAAVEEAKARLDNARYDAARTKSLFERRISSGEDYDRDRFAESAAEATYKRAVADLERIKAGSWSEDLEIARAAVVQAEAQVESAVINIERLTVQALSDGEVLQVNVRPGQYAAMAWKEPLIVLGDVNTLHVRVGIDENDLAYFKSGRDAVGRLRSRPDVEFPLTWVKTEPYVIPKRSLTGDNSERVDVRVLEVVYAIENAPFKVYVGQIMDVAIKIEEYDKVEAKAKTAE